MAQPQQHQLPNALGSAAVKLEDIIEVTDRLNAILIKESALLAAMQLKDIGPLQEEKLMLSARLQSYQRVLAADESIAGEAHPASRDRLLTMANDLAGNIQENLRLTTIAQNVNRRVMQTFIEALAIQQRANTYSDQGTHENGSEVMVSININERA